MRQCDKVIEERSPDIIAIDKKEQKGIIIDISVAADVRVVEKRKDESGKEPGLEKRIWKVVKNRNGRTRTCGDRSPWKCHKRI